MSIKVSELLNGDMELRYVEYNQSVHQSIDLMLGERITHLPVRRNGEIIGIFTRKSLTRHLLQLKVFNTAECPVEDVMEKDIGFVSLDEDIDKIPRMIYEKGCVLVGSRKALLGIITMEIILEHYHKSARGFYLIGEIEKGLRLLIKTIMSEQAFQNYIELAFSFMKKNKRPKAVDDMTFGNLKYLLDNEENWEKFEQHLSPKENVITRLEDIRILRNKLFHFRMEKLRYSDYNSLESTRDWIYTKLDRIGKFQNMRQT